MCVKKSRENVAACLVYDLRQQQPVFRPHLPCKVGFSSFACSCLSSLCFGFPLEDRLLRLDPEDGLSCRVSTNASTDDQRSFAAKLLCGATPSSRSGQKQHIINVINVLYWFPSPRVQQVSHNLPAQFFLIVKNQKNQHFQTVIFIRKECPVGVSWVKNYVLDFSSFYIYF